MILIWGHPADAPTRRVAEELERYGARMAFLDQRAVGDTKLDIEFDGSVRGWLQVGADRVRLEEIESCYVRPYDMRDLEGVGADGSGRDLLAQIVGVDDVLSSWTDLTPAFVVNRPSDMAGNSSKPFQAEQIRAHGFRVPETLMTTDAEAVREFAAVHGSVIYKSMSSVRSIVTRLSKADEDRLESLRWCPTQFQAHVPGLDHRVHVVGDEVFACTVRSAADDYRYPGGDESVEIRPCALPDPCREACVRLAHALGLWVAGIDLRRTADGSWCCFEVNPSPGFTYFSAATGHPIAEAIARLLMRGGA